MTMPGTGCSTCQGGLFGAMVPSAFWSEIARRRRRPDRTAGRAPRRPGRPGRASPQAAPGRCQRHRLGRGRCPDPRSPNPRAPARTPPPPPRGPRRWPRSSPGRSAPPPTTPPRRPRPTAVRAERSERSENVGDVGDLMRGERRGGSARQRKARASCAGPGTARVRMPARPRSTLLPNDSNPRLLHANILSYGLGWFKSEGKLFHDFSKTSKAAWRIAKLPFETGRNEAANLITGEMGWGTTPRGTRTRPLGQRVRGTAGQSDTTVDEVTDAARLQVEALVTKSPMVKTGFAGCPNEHGE